MTFGFHTNVVRKCEDFCHFNSLRKNYLLGCYEEIKDFLKEMNKYSKDYTKYKDYYFIPTYEIG